MTSFVLGTRSATQNQVIDPAHPPVVRALKAATGQGELRYGTLVVLNGSSLVIPWDGVTATPLGVLVETLDTALELTARVLVHGTVKQDSLWVKDATPAAPTAAQLALLETKGIWANRGEL